MKDNDTICNSNVYEQIYKKYALSIKNYIYYKYGNASDAEDVVQNAFIKLWENCSKISVEKAKSFLYTTANNMTLNILKHNKIVLKHSEHYKKNINNESPEFMLLEKEFDIKIQKVINSLTPKQREVFLLNRIEKLKYKEIAELLNISIKAVEKRMHSTLLIIRKEIGKV